MYRPAEDADLGDLHLLGQGGTAEISRAYHRRLKRTVAVKYARPDSELSPLEFTGLVKREYALIGGSRFPGLVRFLDNPAPSFDRIIMEYCAGPSLDRIGRVDDLRWAMNVISALALDLEFLRAAGLVHGDLKPQNAFLPSGGLSAVKSGLWFPKLSDFSLGRRTDESESTRLGLGTVGYMAPETVREKRTGHPSDLFALGVIAYQLLTGRHPFMADDTDPVKVNGRVCESSPTPPQLIRSELPDRLVAVVMQLLEKEEDRRPASAWAVCETLKQVGSDYPFTRALRPAFLIRAAAPFDETVTNLLALTDRERERVVELCDARPEDLRLLLTGNFIGDRMAYEDGRFRFTGPILWPSRMRRRVLHGFAVRMFGERRQAVSLAIAGSSQPVAGPAPQPDRGSAWPPPAMLPLLRQFLHPATIRRRSTKLAPMAYRLEQFETAARLHLQSGNLVEAERCAELAVAAMVKENRTADALALLQAIDRHARLSNREFAVRYGLKLMGTIQKDAGDLNHAEKTYLRVIGLYRDRPVDKLLAETYKYLGDVYRLRQDGPAALEALERSLAVFRDLGDELEISHTLTNMGNVHWLNNDTRKARDTYLDAYRIQKRLRAKADMASTLHNIASVYCMRGVLRRGIFLFNHALVLKREVGHLGEIARTLNNLGYAYQLSGSTTRAADALAESLDINRRIGSKIEILYNIENLATLQIASGRLQEAQDLLAEGLLMARSGGFVSHEGTFEMLQAAVYQHTGRYGDALGALAEVERLLPSLSDYTLELLADVRHASIRRDIGDPGGALALAEETYRSAVRMANSVVELECLLLLARLTDSPDYWGSANRIVDERRLRREHRILRFGRLEYLLEQGDINGALELAASLLPELSSSERDLERAWMLNLAGVVELNRQRRDAAAEMFQQAGHLADQSGLVPERIIALTMLGQIAKIEGDFERAFTSCKQALGLCRLVAEGIPDPDDRNRFLSRQIVQSLAAEIKSLGKRLGPKAKADR